MMVHMMDAQKKHQRLNEAAEQFADALVQSYQVVSELGVTTQERNVQLSEQLTEQQQRRVEAAQALTLETVDAYMDFASSVFGFWHRDTQVAEMTSK